MSSKVARSDVVGSLLRPEYLRQARRAAREGTLLGLYTTKQGALEDEAAVEARIHEASRTVPLERLAVSPQCGFASGEAGNPLTPEEQAAKLRSVAEVARRVWR